MLRKTPSGQKMMDVDGDELQPAPAQASRTRYWVVVFGMSPAVLSYIDRVSLAKAAPLISKSLHLTKTQIAVLDLSTWRIAAMIDVGQKADGMAWAGN
jgi:hypothetical protein